MKENRLEFLSTTARHISAAKVELDFCITAETILNSEDSSEATEIVNELDSLQKRVLALLDGGTK